MNADCSVLRFTMSLCMPSRSALKFVAMLLPPLICLTIALAIFSAPMFSFNL